MNYNYETKCRRCGKLHEWAGLNAPEFSFHQHISSMISKLEIPSTYHCDKCKKQTVQDIVSYEQRNLTNPAH